MIWKASPEVSGGRQGLGFMFIEKFQRKDGSKWIDVPVAADEKRTQDLPRRGRINDMHNSHRSLKKKALF